VVADREPICGDLPAHERRQRERAGARRAGPVAWHRERGVDAIYGAIPAAVAIVGLSFFVVLPRISGDLLTRSRLRRFAPVLIRIGTWVRDSEAVLARRDWRLVGGICLPGLRHRCAVGMPAGGRDGAAATRVGARLPDRYLANLSRSPAPRSARRRAARCAASVRPASRTNGCRSRLYHALRTVDPDPGGSIRVRQTPSQRHERSPPRGPCRARRNAVQPRQSSRPPSRRSASAVGRAELVDRREFGHAVAVEVADRRSCAASRHQKPGWRRSHRLASRRPISISDSTNAGSNRRNDSSSPRARCRPPSARGEPCSRGRGARGCRRNGARTLHRQPPDRTPRRRGATTIRDRRTEPSACDRRLAVEVVRAPLRRHPRLRDLDYMFSPRARRPAARPRRAAVVPPV